MSRPLLLAIDDDPSRYDALRLHLRERAILRIVTCPSCVAEWLPTCDAVLLDYDLDDKGRCAGCGRIRDDWYGLVGEPYDASRFRPPARKGSFHIRAIAARQVPVIVTSSSHPSNVGCLIDGLIYNGANFVRSHRADSPGATAAWIGELWIAGVLR